MNVKRRFTACPRSALGMQHPATNVNVGCGSWRSKPALSFGVRRVEPIRSRSERDSTRRHHFDAPTFCRRSSFQGRVCFKSASTSAHSDCHSLRSSSGNLANSLSSRTLARSRSSLQWIRVFATNAMLDGALAAETRLQTDNSALSQSTVWLRSLALSASSSRTSSVVGPSAASSGAYAAFTGSMLDYACLHATPGLPTEDLRLLWNERRGGRVSTSRRPTDSRPNTPRSPWPV
jgi:hypothetical protein